MLGCIHSVEEQPYMPFPAIPAVVLVAAITATGNVLSRALGNRRSKPRQPNPEEVGRAEELAQQEREARMLALEAQRSAADADHRASEAMALAARTQRIRDWVVIGTAILVGVLAIIAFVWYIA